MGKKYCSVFSFFACNNLISVRSPKLAFIIRSTEVWFFPFRQAWLKLYIDESDARPQKMRNQHFLHFILNRLSKTMKEDRSTLLPAGDVPFPPTACRWVPPPPRGSHPCRRRSSIPCSRRGSGSGRSDSRQSRPGPEQPPQSPDPDPRIPVPNSEAQAAALVTHSKSRGPLDFWKKRFFFYC